MNNQRKMLYISTHKKDDAFFVLFELGNYYRRRDRAVVAEQALTTFNSKELLADPLFYQRMIDYVVTGVEVEITELLQDKEYPCHLLYPFFRNAKDVLRKDREFYKADSKRIFCDELIVEKQKWENLHKNDQFKSKVARIICKHLPLGPFPHELDEKAPRINIEIDQRQPLFYDGWCD